MDSYEINVETLLILPFGKEKSKIYELDGDFIVNKSPLAIIKDSCLYFGCTYEGRQLYISQVKNDKFYEKSLKI